jgi:hypothetical protein
MSSTIQVKCATSFASISELMKSPAKRLSPLQPAAAQMAPVWTFGSTTVTLQVGVGLVALNDSAHTAAHVDVVMVLVSLPLSGV